MVIGERLIKKILKIIEQDVLLFVKYKNINVIIDTSPDIKNQMLKNKIKKIDAVIYTHEHADQTHGINELKTIFLD